MADDMAGLLITGFFTLAGSLGGSAATLYAGSRRDRQLDGEAALARNLELRRSAIAEFVAAFDEVAELAGDARGSQALLASSEARAGSLETLRQRLRSCRASLEVLCRDETRVAVDAAEVLAAQVCKRLAGRAAGPAPTLDALASSMADHKAELIRLFKVELGEPGR